MWPFGRKQQNKEVKLCVNCKHLIDDGSRPKDRPCAVGPLWTNFDMVTGETETCRSFANWCRRDDDKCGPKAKWFEPKEADSGEVKATIHVPGGGVIAKMLDWLRG